jgi:glucose-1-phosphate adenylyltransferase
MSRATCRPLIVAENPKAQQAAARASLVRLPGDEATAAIVAELNRAPTSLQVPLIEILAAEQTPENRDWFQGTADAVRQVMPHILEFDPAYVVILSGDHLYQMNYRQFLDRHIDTKAHVSVSVIPCTQEEASNYGLVRTDSDGLLTEFREKPAADQLESMRVDTALLGLSREEADRRPFLASMGVYVFSLEALRDLLKDGQHQDFGGEVIPAAIKQYKVQSFLFDGYWEDIGTISAFYNANLDMASIMPKFNLFDADTPIFTRPRFLPGSKLVDCEVRNSIVTDGCILNRASIINSIIGLRSRIGNFSRIEYSLLMGADYYQTIDDLVNFVVGKMLDQLGVKV